MERRLRGDRDEFRRKIKEEWASLWKERFDDKVKAEGVSIHDYPLLLTDRGSVIFASRDAKTPNFSEIMNFWSSRGLIYSPEPTLGGWRRFAHEELRKLHNSRSKEFKNNESRYTVPKHQMRKGGRGWLHK